MEIRHRCSRFCLRASSPQRSPSTHPPHGSLRGQILLFKYFLTKEEERRIRRKEEEREEEEEKQPSHNT
ncbi:hypothetical protein E2C01_016136 [Portunus trituberculatus]|uniref:Uncharacterized protein n=1 Tax=Portunus trituberculatus TaxID=210409 RepID=A0A5B7DNS4_PORTR|nr:hypothetical protein [Portunus trituberculatus]